jgi:magnesium transporter
MISIYGVEDGRLTSLEPAIADPAQFVWVDLLSPSPEEEAAVERIVGLDVPTREEMQEIELSSRLYMDGEAAFMTASILSHTDQDDAMISPVTFILAGQRLITVRYEDPRFFGAFARRAQKTATGCTNADAVLAHLLEAVIERLADILERAAHDIDAISRNIFQPAAKPAPAEPPQAKGKARRKQPRTRDFQVILEDIGRKGELASNIRDSLVTLQRLFTFLAQLAAERKPGKDIQTRIKTLSRDAQALSDHVSFLSQKITFLLDATLGMINIEQNAIIKIFSVAAVVFLPPTLIASIYGMNFEHMPELEWPFGYPFAIGLMILSAVLPYLFFKRRGWL